MAVRAIRGATQVDTDDRDHVLELTRELVGQVMSANSLEQDDIISMLFSATRDISSIAPAAAARQLGFNDVALLCFQEMHVEGSMERVVRVVAYIETDRPKSELQNVYLRGTTALRAEVPAFQK